MIPLLTSRSGFVLPFNDRLSPLLTLTRASAGTRVNAAGLVVSEAVDAPRLDYDLATLAVRGMLSEGAATNLIPFSTASLLQNPPWTTTGSMTVTDNAGVAPDGTSTSTLLTKTAAAGITGSYFAFGIPVAPATIYTASFYGRLGTALAADMRYSLYDEIALGFFASEVAFTQTALSTGWTRLWASFTTPAGCTSLRFYPWRHLNAAAGATLYAWGHQVEAGSAPSAFIPTTGAAATRAADIITMPNTASRIYPGPGSIILTVTLPALPAASNQFLWRWDAGTDANQIRCFAGSTTPVLQAILGSVGQFYLIAPVQTPGVLRLACTWDATSAAICVNGGTVVSGNAITGLPTNPSRLLVGAGISGTGPMYGALGPLRYLPRRMANAELIAATS